VVRAPRTTRVSSVLPNAVSSGSLPIAPGLLQTPSVAPAPAVPDPVTPPDLPAVAPVAPVTAVTPDAPRVVQASVGSVPPIVSEPVPPVASTPATGATTAAPSALQAFVKSNVLTFQSVVLGPINTAVLGSKDGMLVAPLGSTVGQSSVVVKSISADAVVLRLGDETLTLAMGGAR
ncbi:MAG TPA: hypothetical protein VHN99_03740, partial [Deinococcales bacterium]|nr:hypothetical protein [Deinococcales bacterium]